MKSLHVEALDATFGAVVHHVELARLDDRTCAEIHEAWLEFGLLVFPGQRLGRDDQDDFARRFGELEFTATALTNIRRDGSTRSERDHDLNKSLLGNEGWHHDSTFMPVQAKGAVFTAEIIPREGGATGFADMRAAYEALGDADRAAVVDRTARHSRRYSMERAGHDVAEVSDGGHELYGYGDIEPPIRPLVTDHAETGRPHLVIGQHAYGVSGLDEGESLALLDRLNSEACSAPRTYHHSWTVGDAVLWDNRRLMHRATPYAFDEPRRMWHTRIAGDAATETALNYR